MMATAMTMMPMPPQQYGGGYLVQFDQNSRASRGDARHGLEDCIHDTQLHRRQNERQCADNRDYDPAKYSQEVHLPRDEAEVSFSSGNCQRSADSECHQRCREERLRIGVYGRLREQDIGQWDEKNTARKQQQYRDNKEDGFQVNHASLPADGPKRVSVCR